VATAPTSSTGEWFTGPNEAIQRPRRAAQNTGDFGDWRAWQRTRVENVVVFRPVSNSNLGGSPTIRRSRREYDRINKAVYNNC
jgi:hypothetical protein